MNKNLEYLGKDEKLKPILVIDDEEMIGDFIQAALETENIQSVYFKKPNEALRDFHKDKYLAAIIDYKMPEYRRY